MAKTTPTIISGAASGALTVDLAATGENWRRLARRHPAGRTGAVVKADAYGLGLEAVAPALYAAGARCFYVAQVEEGLKLRTLLPDAAIHVLAPIMPEALAPARAGGLTITLNGEEALAAWRADAKAAGSPLPATLHIDTGMTRLGVDDADVPNILASLAEAERAAIVEVASHLACADEPSHPANRSQLARFQAATKAFEPSVVRCLANSSGIFLAGAFLQDATRPGMALYGLNPTPKAINPMAPVVGLTVKLLQARRLDRAETVGYGATATAPADARIATIAAGYADGLHRSLSGRGAVYIQGRRAPIIGRVSMDLIAIDVTDIPENLAHAGAEVEIIGPNQSADALADAADTIGYEILTSLGRRYRRSYISGEDVRP